MEQGSETQDATAMNTAGQISFPLIRQRVIDLKQGDDGDPILTHGMEKRYGT